MKSSVPEDTMNELKKAASFDEGLTAQVRGDFDAAIAIFEEVINKHPANAAAYHQAGRCHMRLGALDRAIENLETAVRLGPDRIPARLDLGLLYLAMSDVSKAKAQFLHALSRNSSNVKVITSLGIAHFHEKDFGKAISRLQEANTLNPSNFASHFYLARTHRALENPDGVQGEALRSAAICRDLIRVRTEQPEGYYFLGETFVLQREFRLALQNFLIARDFSPEGALHFFAFGLHYTLLDNYIGIARCYRRLGENRYARYFGQLILKMDTANEEAKKYASLED
jgi:tetratricopeptide (TPR) repeat protein